MGRTYKPKNRKTGDFDMNYAGCRVLSAISEKISFVTEIPDESKVSRFYRKDEIMRLYDFDPKWEASKEEAEAAAEKLSNVPVDEWLPIYETVNNELFGGSFEDFLALVNEWVSFLRNSGGYKVPM